jgi:triosephosphate isomerase
MNKFLIAGNWKMNTTFAEADRLVAGIIDEHTDISSNVKLLVCPPFTHLATVAQRLKGSKVSLGAQNCHWEEKGAYTGEISLSMLKDAGCEYVIIGHSERRAMFCETNENINKKLHAILAQSLIPIVCIGETLEQRESGQTFDVLERQLIEGLKDIPSSQIAGIIIAYEPVWAIGTGVAASIEQVDEAHNKIREMLVTQFGETANETIIQYGGSVNAKNSSDLFALENVNGALIGGASLNAESFMAIYNNALAQI